MRQAFCVPLFDALDRVTQASPSLVIILGQVEVSDRATQAVTNTITSRWNQHLRRPHARTRTNTRCSRC